MTMNRDRSHIPDDTGDEMINRVLAAESRAQDGLRRCQAEAAEIVSQAHLRARRIRDRADARVSRLRAECLRRSAQRAEELQREAEAARLRPVQQDARRARLEETIARLAAALTVGG